jgi:adenosylcobinamide-phosphate synthase
LENLAVLVIAVALDLALGDPPNAFHPVAWLGRLIGLAARAPVKGKKRQFAYGMAVVISIAGTITAGMYILLVYLHGLNPAAYVIAGALVLKSAFTVKGLRSAAVSVRKLLAVGKIQQARYEVRSLVGRETEKLDDSQVASAVVESVAENSCDSLVAPLLYFRRGCLPHNKYI